MANLVAERHKLPEKAFGRVRQNQSGKIPKAENVFFFIEREG